MNMAAIVRVRYSFVLLAAAACAYASAADDPRGAYPARPVRFLLGQPTGGGQDIVARALAQQLSDTVGQPVIVDNRPGAAGTIAAAIAAKALPNGYTALFVSSTYAINPSLYKLPFDPTRDLQSVALVAATPFILLAHPSVPVHSVKDLIAYAKEHPRTLNYASGGTGNSGHLAAELFAHLAHVQ